MTSYYLLPPAVGLLSFFTIKLLLNKRISQALLDIPNKRSSHIKPKPKIGGIAIMVGVLLGSIWLYATVPWLTISMAMTLAVLSFIDDKQGLPALYRLLAHLIAAILVVLYEPAFNNWIISLVVIVFVVWMTNLYNFMDGLDGLAGGMACFGFGTYALTAFLGNNITFSLLNLNIAFATLAFLTFNFPPAKVFMGDTGAIPLGFLAATLGLYGYSHNLWPWWFTIVVFSPFIADATVTLLKRLFRREKIWAAHKEHYYQRLAQKGWGHLYTTLFLYTLMLTSALLAVLLLYQGLMLQLVGVFAWMFILATAMCYFDITQVYKVFRRIRL